MPVLSSVLRKALDDACVRGRRMAEDGCRAELGRLAVVEAKAPSHLKDDERDLRRGLRAKRRQLGDEGGSIELLRAECAFEQWHRLLFARFLAENGLLIHPDYRAPVTLADCAELASELDEPDAWGVAARFAAEILPGIFRLDDPCVRLRLAPESRLALETIVEGLPREVFASDDGLGWVYQYWQREKKDEVNASERKIGGADLGPVTQLFTENYMVRFLLENSLGSWWASGHPKSQLQTEWEYMRVDDEGEPAAGSFEGWPERVAEVTVMDPCCGSGHFLVEAFGMLWRMRAEDEGLSPLAAQDAVLRDNLFGLELDPRCVQIAMFAVAFAAWKAGGGWRELPVPNIGCSGISVKTPVEEWKALAHGDPRLERALEALHVLFKDADTLGSLIDPRRAVETSAGEQVSFESVQWDEVSVLLAEALAREAADPAAMVIGADVAGLSRAAGYLSSDYTLVVTNVPYLGAQRMVAVLSDFVQTRFPTSSWDLATVFIERAAQIADEASVALVTPMGWLFLRNYAEMRRGLLRDAQWHMLALLGEGAFSGVSGAVVKSALLVLSRPARGNRVTAIDASHVGGVGAKTDLLRRGSLVELDRLKLQDSPDRLLALEESSAELLEEFATSWQGLVTGDNGRFVVRFWEISDQAGIWERFVTAPQQQGDHTGRTSYVRWEGGKGALVRSSGAHNFNPSAVLTSRGVVVGQSTLASTLYRGELFNDAASPIIPRDPQWLAPVWAFLSSPEYEASVRRINRTIKVGVGYLLMVPFDIDHWRQVAEEAGPLPEPWSDDPTQWLFEGRPEVSTEPLQVAVGRLLGYRWPEQPESDDLTELADRDGIACLPSVLGERPAAERLREVLARAYGPTWSPMRTRELLASSGSKKTDLDSWLRDEFFKAHCQGFKNRPFVWHIWDGRKDGFSALVNYHRLNRTTLQRLAYTYLGDWIERQTAAAKDEVAGAEARLIAAQDLQRRLELIREGEPPYDIFVRWKSLDEQPLGWDPDVNDGVRLNVRPFVETGILRTKFNVNWNKDRGKNPDGSERLNDLHYSLAEKRTARGV